MDQGNHSEVKSGKEINQEEPIRNKSGLRLLTVRQKGQYKILGYLIMADRFARFERHTQKWYTWLLNQSNACFRGLTQSECEKILMSHGAFYEQAKNGAYVYLHHREHMVPTREGSQEEYDLLLNEFNASQKSPMGCIQYLESLEFSYGQAKTAVYKYRKRKGLIRKKEL